jgi:DegV family protein with EDD domain
LSGTFNAALQGAKDVADAVVHVFDSMTLSGGQRFQVLAAQRAIRTGWGMERIKAQLEKVRAATEVIYTLETLSYLARGGRIGRVQALAGALLNLKPVIRVDRSDGKYSTVGKARTIPKALSQITEHLAHEYGQTALWVSVMHGRFADQAERLAEMLKAQLNVGVLEVLRISPVLGVHTGPGIVGAAVVPLHLLEEIE